MPRGTGQGSKPHPQQQIYTPPQPPEAPARESRIKGLQGRILQSWIFTAAILLIGLCRLFGRNLWLPERIAGRVLPSEKLLAGLNRGRVWVHRLERVSRAHRMPWLASPGMMDTINNLALVAAAVLLMAPFGLIPFSNTLPALALLFFAIGLLQRDGLFIVLGHLSNLVTVIYFSVLIVGGGAAIREIFLRLMGSGS